MNGVDIIEIGAVTVAVEMLGRRSDLAPIWDELSEAHPLEPIAESVYGEAVVDRLCRAIAGIDGIEDKEVVILAGPELIALEAFKKLDLGSEILVAVDRGMSDEAIKRIERNVPSGLRVTVLRDVPDRYLGPGDAVFLAVGLQGGYRLALLPSWVASVASSYASVFSGERLLVDPLGHPVRWRRSLRSDDASGPGWVTEFLETRFTGYASPGAADSRDLAVRRADAEMGSRIPVAVEVL